MVGSGGHVVVLVQKSSTGGGGEDEKINGNGMGPSLDRIPSIGLWCSGLLIDLPVDLLGWWRRQWFLWGRDRRATCT